MLGITLIDKKPCPFIKEKTKVDGIRKSLEILEMATVRGFVRERTINAQNINRLGNNRSKKT